MVTQSADRSVRIYKKSKKGHKLFCAHHIRERETDFEVASKTDISGADDDHGDSSRFFHHKYFHDDSAATFFRRPSWSPEGQFLLLPCGQALDSPTQTEPQNVSWLFTRANLGKSAACCLPSNEISIAARFSPVLYKSLRLPSSSGPSESSSGASSAMSGVESMESKNSSTTFKLFDIDYKLVFAVATVSSIMIYDTEHAHPIAALQDAHYSTLTDLTWSADGNTLAVSSSDGYVSLIQFDEGELGELLEKDDYARVMAPALEARVPKPPEPRKPKKAPTTSATPGDASTAKESSVTDVNASTTETGVQGDDEEDEDSEVDEEEALNGTIINFDDPAAPEPEKKPVVRKEGRRVVTTLVTAPSSSAMDVTPSDPTSKSDAAPTSS